MIVSLIVSFLFTFTFSDVGTLEQRRAHYQSLNNYTCVLTLYYTSYYGTLKRLYGAHNYTQFHTMRKDSGILPHMHINI